MFAYRIYGLTVRSPFRLPGEPVSEGRIDVDVRQERLEGVRAGFSSRDSACEVTRADARFHWKEIGTFQVRNGNEILADPRPGVDERWIGIVLLGPAFAALLQQRGLLILHASAVGIDGRAVAFLGASGSGKSTLAASLHARGHRLITDDIAAIDHGLEGSAIRPGLPQLKLWPDTVSRLGEDPEALNHLNPVMEKRVRPISERFDYQGGMPLHRMYVLSRGSGTTIEPVAPREAFLELVNHSYGIEWLHQLSGPAHFSTRAALATTIPVRRLTRAFDLDLLEHVVWLVEEDTGS